MVVNTHALTQLHDEMDLRPLIDDFMQFHDVRVPQFRKCVDLSVNCLCCRLVLQILLFICLDRNHVLRHFMLGPSHNCKGALADL